MKKRLFIILVAIVLLLLFVPAMADTYAPSYWDDASQSYLYYEPHYGIVICRQMSVRDRPATNGSSYGNITTGQPVKILGRSADGNFYAVDLVSCGFQNTGTATIGYAKSSLIKIDPECLIAKNLTNVYATPWSTSLKNGERPAGYVWLIIEQQYNWYAVQAMSSEKSIGTGFVLTSDVGNYSGYQQKYIVTWDAALLDEYSWTQAQTVKRWTVGTIYSDTGDYVLLVFNEGEPSEIRGWVSKQFVAPIIN